MGIFNWFSKKNTQESQQVVKDNFPEKDAWEGYYYSDYENKKINIPLNITYIDRENQISNRDITAKVFWRINEEDEDFLYAICHVRDAGRTFRISRISEMTVLDTGEIINKENYLSFLEEEHMKSPEYVVSQILLKYQPEIQLMLFIAQSDGRFTAKEKEILFKYLSSKENKELTEDEIKELTKKLKEVNATQTKAKKYSKMIRESNDIDTQLVLNLLEEVIGLSKTVNPITEASFKLVKDILIKD